MRTSIETQTNTTPWVERLWISPVDRTRNILNNSLLSTIERWDIIDKKWREKALIKRETIEETKPLTNETHFIVEKQLAEMFWLDNEKVSKLREDFKEPMTLTWVLAEAEQNYWETV